MADDDFKKLIHASPATEPELKNGRSFFSSVKWGLLFIVVIGGVALLFNAYFTHKYEMPRTVVEKDKEPKPSEYEFQIQEQLRQKDAAKQQLLDPAPKAEEARPREDIGKLSDRIDKIDHKTDALAAYIAARDLEESVDNPAGFKENLGLLHKYFTGVPDIAGRLDILDQASAGGIVTREKLLDELKVIEKDIQSNSDSGITGSIGNALGQLVKVTKVRGDIEADDYESIIRRAEIRLSAQNIDDEQLQQTINEVAKLGKPAEQFVAQANNLKRVMDAADNIVEYAKSKLAE